ncbi:MAG: chromate efflux transporter [Myxococcota bacterium]
MTERGARLLELAALFFRIGATTFGGPAAHIAVLHDEVVRRRGWLSEDEFVDLLGAVNLIPGPNSTELAIHVGYRRAGVPGLVVSGVCFILPAMALTGVLGWAYVRYGALPDVGWLLEGIKPVILAVVLQALWALAVRVMKGWPLRALGLGCVGASALGAHELLVLFGAGLAVLAGRRVMPRPPPSAALLAAPLSAGVATSVGLSGLFWVFLKAGALLFGSGYVLLAFLRADLVERLGWLTEAQLIDAIAAGQVTPGPVFTTATFIGMVLGGWQGALVATVAIFLPAFVYVALSAPLLPRLRASKGAAAFVDGVNVAAVALMAVVAAQLAHAAVVDVATGVLAVLSALVLLRFKVNATWLVLAGAAAAWILHRV